MDNARVYEFGQFRLEPAERQLLRAGRLVALTPKAFETLHALVAGGGRAVSKDDLMRGSPTGAFLDAVQRGLNLYRHDSASWRKLMRIGMKQDWSWDRSAAEYEKLYGRLCR